VPRAIQVRARAAFGMRRDPKSVGEYPQQVGPMHSIEAIPAARVGGEYATNDRSVHPIIFGAVPDLGADLRQRVAQSHSFQWSQAVGKNGNAGANLAQRAGLFENRDVNARSKQRIRG